MSKTEETGSREVLYYIYRATMTVNGVLLRAKDYGKRAFKIPVYK